MECLTNEYFIGWLSQYGSFALYVLLALGIFALPIPDETLIVISGALIHAGTLPLLPTVLATYAGAMTGITLSYLVGYGCGHFLLHKHIGRYGKWFGLTEKRFAKAHEWFEHYGVWLLFFGYFIPGVRHFTGLVTGAFEVKYSHFALFAYTGAFFWASIFLSVGYFFGSFCLPAAVSYLF